MLRIEARPTPNNSSADIEYKWDMIAKKVERYLCFQIKSNYEDAKAFYCEQIGLLDSINKLDENTVPLIWVCPFFTNVKALSEMLKNLLEHISDEAVTQPTKVTNSRQRVAERRRARQHQKKSIQEVKVSFWDTDLKCQRTFFLHIVGP